MLKNKLENSIIENAKKKNGGALPDEREQLENSNAMNAACAIGLLFDIVMMFYYFITRNIEKSYPYLAQLLVISVVFALVSFGGKTVKPPRTLWSREVDYSKGGKAFAKRALMCSLEQLLFAAALIAFDAYTEKKVTGSIVTDAIFTFVILALIDITVCELRVRSFRKFLDRLDEEENSIDDEDDDK